VAFPTDRSELFGFAVWSHLEAAWGEQGTRLVIRVPWFGVDQRFWGERDSEDRSCARRLFATLEGDARSHEDSTDEMPIELFCDERNDRGLRFWSRLGFEDIGTADGAAHIRRLIR
jgi:hypothetical protein